MCYITRENYWKKISLHLYRFIQSVGLTPIDIYLIGSSLDTLTQNIALELNISDIDSIILIEDMLTINSLRDLRVKIQTFLRVLKVSDLYHFKIFTKYEMEILSKYDGFRVFEIQDINFSLHQSDAIMGYTPCFSKKGFCNSLLAQLMYEFLMKDGYLLKNKIWYSNKITQRIKRNTDIIELYSKKIRTLYHQPI